MPRSLSDQKIVQLFAAHAHTSLLVIVSILMRFLKLIPLAVVMSGMHGCSSQEETVNKALAKLSVNAGLTKPEWEAIQKALAAKGVTITQHEILMFGFYWKRMNSGGMMYPTEIEEYQRLHEKMKPILK